MNWRKRSDMNVLVFDNYDSFTYNLVHLVEKILEKTVTVKRNDAITPDEAAAFDRIILSPGPGIPEEAGCLLDLIRALGPVKPLLGVCLGHQAIAEAFGGTLVNLSKVYHGVATPVQVIQPQCPLFRGLPEQLHVGRYHSWMVKNDDLPDCLEITAVDEQGAIMAMQHRQYRIQGVQFHPESVLTPLGESIIRNWLLNA